MPRLPEEIYHYSEKGIQIEHEGKKYTIPEFCPHAGEPLKFAEAQHGRIVCPFHLWSFDLETGRCTTGDTRINLYHYLRRENPEGR